MKKNNGLMEGIRFILTGGVCFLVEFACLVFLRDTVGLDTLIATPIAFLVSVILNYLLCVKELLMLIFRGIFGEDAVVLTLFGFTVTMYMINKVLATGIVMVWNYFTKRAILKKGIFHKKENK